ncbi:MAG: BlaI/MecI/CopY family transcriptional regulator [Acidobacteriia bacterium]|nr:BlaI/MecI/CopY family transcriptional regulator [Terriglobia bacterium]
MNRIFRLFQPLPLTNIGPLEEQLLQSLSQRDSATVRELIDDGNLPLAYTTVMTTLDRLYKKNLLDRVAEGRAFRYSLRYTQQEIQRAAAGQAIRQLLGSEATPSLPLSYLVEAVSEHDSELLDELQQLVERERRRMSGKHNKDNKDKETR